MTAAATGGLGRVSFAHWLAVDVVWKIGAGVLVGAFVGAALGWLTFHIPNKSTVLARTGDGFVALGAAALAYGLVQMVNGYGFVGVFATSWDAASRSNTRSTCTGARSQQSTPTSGSRGWAHGSVTVTVKHEAAVAAPWPVHSPIVAQRHRPSLVAAKGLVDDSRAMATQTSTRATPAATRLDTSTTRPRWSHGNCASPAPSW